MKRPCLRLCFAVLFGVAFAVGAITSYAQESGSDEFHLEEITVTAQKRAENQQKVAIAMEVITGEDLVGTGKDNVDDILRDISNVIIGKNEDGMRITIRGLVDDDPMNSDMHMSTPTVAVNIDGAYNSSSSAGQNLFDVERVEVLAGPQSTLYGSNSPGGVVNVVTVSPKTDKFSGNASVEFGSYDLIDGQVAVNVPIIKDLLAMRFAAQAYQRGGWMEGVDNEQETTTARLKTMIEPSDTFNATVTVNYSEAASGGRLNGMARLFDYEDGQYEDGTPVTNPWLSKDWAVTDEGTEPDPMKSDRESKGIQAEINWDTAIGSITFVPYTNESESTAFSNDVEMTFAGDDTVYYTSQYRENYADQTGADLRITSPEDFPFKWIVGGTWLDAETADVRDDLMYDSNDASSVFTQDNKAIYANITYPVTDTFRGTVGYRRSWDDVKTVAIPGKGGVPVYITGQEYSRPDYKLGAEYDLSEDSMLWVSYATSYRLDPMTLGVDMVSEPQTLKSYSAGVKSRFFDNKLQLNATAYFYDYRNKWFRGGETAQSRNYRGRVFKESDYPHDGLPGYDFNFDGDFVDTNLPPGSPDLLPGESSDLVGYNIWDPLGKQFGDFESFGVDVSMDWVPTGKDRVNVQLSYMDAEWTNAIVKYQWPLAWPLYAGMSHNGKRATFSPEWTVNASYEHRFDLGSIGTLIPEIDMQYKSEYFLAFETVERPGRELWVPPWIVQEPHYLLNGSVTFNHSSDIWSIRAYVKNATDYAAKNFWGGFWDIYLGLSDPRTFGAVVSVKF